MSGRYNNPDDNSLVQQIAELKRRLDRLEVGKRINYTAIDGGQLSVDGGAFTVGNPFHVYFGPVVQGVGTTPGWIFRRANLNNAFTLGGADDQTQYWALYDDENNIIVSDDADTGRGLGRPYIPISHGVHYLKTMPISTVSATFEGMHIFRFKKQQPKIYIDPMIKCSDGTTGGEYQIYDNVVGQPVTDPVTITPGLLGRVPVGPFTVDGDYMANMELELQARRTAGVGSIAIEIYNAYGQQS